MTSSPKSGVRPYAIATWAVFDILSPLHCDIPGIFNFWGSPVIWDVS